jgi:hypothetical protein
LIHMLSHEKELLNINDFSNTKLFQSQIWSDLLKKIIIDSFKVLKNTICNLVYLNTVSIVKIWERSKEYKTILKILSTKKNISIIPNDYQLSNYIPWEHFSLPKNSEIWISLKIISKLIIDNDILENRFKDLIKNINRYNPNWENFFKTETLNPYTVNRWKISEIKNDYEITEEKYKIKIKELNEIANQKIISKLLKDKNLKSDNKEIKYLKSEFEFVQNKIEKNFIWINHLILLVNKFESYKSFLEKRKNNKKKVDSQLIKDIKELNKNLGSVNKILSQLNWYKIHLMENFWIENYSFLAKSWEYYFVLIKKEENLTNFLNFVNNLHKWNDDLFYLDSITWNWFKKLFLSELSNAKFKNWKNIKEYNKWILVLEEKIIKLKKQIIEKITKEKRNLTEQIKNSILKWIIDKEVKDFLNFCWESDLSKLVFVNKKNNNNKFNDKVYWKKLIDFCNETYNTDNVSTKSDLENLENQYFEEIKKLIIEIKDLEYSVWSEYKNLNFIENLNEVNNLEELKNYFDNKWYKVENKKIDFHKLLELSKNDDLLKIYQIKSKDLKFYPDFVVEWNIWNTSTALNNKKLKNSNKD